MLQTAFQKAVFRVLKCGLLQRKRRSFILRFAVVCSNVRRERACRSALFEFSKEIFAWFEINAYLCTKKDEDIQTVLVR